MKLIIKYYIKILICKLYKQIFCKFLLNYINIKKIINKYI